MMKKLFLSAVILLMLACSLLIFQIGCTKDSTAQSPSENTDGIKQLNKILYQVWSDQGDKLEAWVANYDGSNKTKIILPATSEMRVGDDIRLSPDGKKVFFTGEDASGSSVYSSNIDGSNLNKVASIPKNDGMDEIMLLGVY